MHTDMNRVMNRQAAALQEFASQSPSTAVYLDGLGNILQHLTHRFSNAHILEIGDNSGSDPAATSMLCRITGQNAAYTIACPDHDALRELQTRCISGLVPIVLDIEEPVTGSTRPGDTYDIIIVPNPLQLARMESPYVAFENMRKLMRPGGFLIMLNIGGNDSPRAALISAMTSLGGLESDRHTSTEPYFTESANYSEHHIVKAGFSATSRIIHPNQSRIVVPMYLSICQALNERVAFFREPLSPNTGFFKLDTLTIVCANHERRQCLGRMVQKNFRRIQFLDTLSDFARVEVPIGGTVVHITDEEALSRVFKHLTPTSVHSFRNMFKRSRIILWATSGTDSARPYASIFKGLHRVISLELSDVNIQTIDFSSETEIDVRLVATKLLQLAASCSWHNDEQLKDILWCREPEIKVQGGQILIPRLRQSPERNRRYNSAQRYITEDINTRICLSIEPTHHDLRAPGSHNAYPSFVVRQRRGVPRALSESEHEVRLTHSFLKPISVTENDAAFLSLGQQAGKPDRVFVLTDSLESQVDALPSWTLPAPSFLPDALKRLSCLYAELLALVMMEKASRGRNLAVLNPWTLLGRALVRLAAENVRDVPILISTSSINSSGLPWAHLHPLANDRSIRVRLPNNLATFFDMNDGIGRASASLARCLPSTCRRVMRSHIIHEYAQLDSSPAGIRRIGDYFQAAWCGSQSLAKSLSLDPVPIPGALELNDLSTATWNESSTPVYQTVVAWANSNTVAVPVHPASELVSFPSDKTYWLVGLTGGLGLSLCEWMADRGARYFVLSSRDPRTDQSWIMTMSSRGCTVRIFAK